MVTHPSTAERWYSYRFLWLIQPRAVSFKTTGIISGELGQFFLTDICLNKDEQSIKDATLSVTSIALFAIAMMFLQIGRPNSYLGLEAVLRGGQGAVPPPP